MSWTSYVTFLENQSRWEDLDLLNNARNGMAIRDFQLSPEYVTEIITDHDPDIVLSYMGLADVGNYFNSSAFYIHYKWLIDTLQ